MCLLRQNITQFTFEKKEVCVLKDTLQMIYKIYVIQNKVITYKQVQRLKNSKNQNFNEFIISLLKEKGDR